MEVGEYVRSGDPKRLRKLMVLDTSYSWSGAQRRGIEQAFFQRSLEGYFSEVWSVNPLVQDEDIDARCVRMSQVGDGHWVVEARVRLGSVGNPAGFARFVLTQAQLVAVCLRIIKRRQIGVLRAGDPLYTGAISSILSTFARVPFVVRVPGNYDLSRSLTGRAMMPRLFRSVGLERFVERKVLEKAAFVVAPNEDNKSYALRAGAKSNTTRVIRYGSLLDPRYFEATRPRLEVPDPDNDEVVVLTVSRLEVEKRVDDTLRAFSYVHQSYPTAQLWVVGEGAERDRLGTLAVELGISHKTIFWGTQDQSWLLAAYAKCSAFVSPQAGRALCEAALRSAPIVAYDWEWQGELVRDSETGLLCASGDFAALGRSISRLLGAPGLAAELGARARDAAIHMLDPATSVTLERQVFETVMLHGDKVPGEA